MKDLPEDLGSFELLGLSTQLTVDDEKLRQTFYELSKKIHPDRYTQKSPREAMAAARWSTRLNRAYQEIRHRDSRIEALLSRFEKQAPKSAVPVDLAETYFELQELLHEDGGRENLAAFQKELGAIRADIDDKLAALGTAWQIPPTESQVRDLRSLYDQNRYLNSMAADIEKKLGSAQ